MFLDLDDSFFFFSLFPFLFSFSLFSPAAHPVCPRPSRPFSSPINARRFFHVLYHCNVPYLSRPFCFSWRNRGGNFSTRRRYIETERQRKRRNLWRSAVDASTRRRNHVLEKRQRSKGEEVRTGRRRERTEATPEDEDEMQNRLHKVPGSAIIAHRDWLDLEKAVSEGLGHLRTCFESGTLAENRCHRTWLVGWLRLWLGTNLEAFSSSQPRRDLT